MQLDSPDLTFPTVQQGKNETPWDLRRLLYKGGASTRVDLVAESIRNGSLGALLVERLPLVTGVHAVVGSKLAAGGSQATAKTMIKTVESMFRWADRTGYSLSLDSAKDTYLHWTDNLCHRVRVARDITQHTAYTLGRVVGQVLDEVLGRQTPLIELTRLTEPKRRKTVAGIKAEKQNLQDAFAFGRLMQDICDGLTLEVIRGPRPFRIPLSDGGEIVKLGGLQTRIRPSIDRSPQRERSRLAKAAAKKAAFESDTSASSRSTVVNMRILAELLMFIGQTGMNLAQASNLHLRHFSYASDLDGYKVRDYKARRGGEVLFEIFKEYRSHFERYLEWRRALFAGETRLFPLIRSHGAHEASRPYFGLIQQACRDAGVSWHPPSLLRGTRVNWLLRRTGDPDLAAAMAQHHTQMLLRHYAVPSQHRAVGEITRFWQSADPTLAKSTPLISVAPGECDGRSAARSDRPLGATAPDCMHPSGCLWCEHHRDIDSFDYVWALASFSHLKSVEISRHHPSSRQLLSSHPAHFALERIGDKLSWFRDSNASRRAWVEEALARLEEADFHPEWAPLINEMQGTSR